MSIEDRIKSLRSKVTENGATEDEMMTALAMADKLMKKHGLTEADLARTEFKRDMKENMFRQKQVQLHPSQKWCSRKIGEFCGVKMWTSPEWREDVPGYKTRKVIRMFGYNDDVEMAEFLLGLIHDSMDRGWKDFCNTFPKDPEVSRHTQYWNYMMGFADRINARLVELMKPMEVGTGTDLVATKMSLVEQGMAEMLPDVQLVKSNSRGINGDPLSNIAGRAAGDKVNLNRPIATKKAGGRLINKE